MKERMTRRKISLYLRTHDKNIDFRLTTIVHLMSDSDNNTEFD